MNLLDEGNDLSAYCRKPRRCVVDSPSLDDPEGKFVDGSEEEEDIVLKDEHDPLSTDDES